MAMMGKQSDNPALGADIIELATQIVLDLEDVHPDVKINAVARVFAAYCHASDVTREQAMSLLSRLFDAVGMQRSN